MKALERRPADRHQSAGELQRELNEFLEEAGLKSGSRRLSQYMKELFASEPAEPGDATAKAHVFGDGASGLSASDGDEPEELDFDRRAPLTLRVEARADAGAFGDKGPGPPLFLDRRGDAS